MLGVSCFSSSVGGVEDMGPTRSSQDLAGGEVTLSLSVGQVRGHRDSPCVCCPVLAVPPTRYSEPGAQRI